MNRYTLTIACLAALTLAAIILSVQLPFAYYSADDVFHAAKIMAARDGELTVDPITGFETVYPPLFHTIFGGVARLARLTGFQTTRMIQVVDFVGLILGVWVLAGVILKSREKGALAALISSLLIYAPTGKYVFLQNPFNLSVIFCLLGTASILYYHRSGRLRWGLVGAVVFGVGVNIWWWNIIPLSGLLLGLLVAGRPREPFGRTIGRLLIPAGAAALTLVYSLAVLASIRDILPYYNYPMPAYSFAGQHSLGRTVAEWLGGFILNGNQPFLDHLFPAALSSSNRLVVLYGLFASVHFYLLVVPFNLVVIWVAGVCTIREARMKTIGPVTVLTITAAVTLLGSIAALFLTDPSVLGRLQFYCYLFLLPGFIGYAYDRIPALHRRRFEYAAVLVGSGVMLFVTVYRFNLDLDNPLPEPTREVVRWLEERPDHARTRIFTTGYDALILAREVRYRGFVLDIFHPTYFRHDKPRADSIYNAYQSIVSQDDKAEFWLKTFDTRFAIIGKTSVNISAVISNVTENRLSESMRAFFAEHGSLLFENDGWVVFDLRRLYEAPAAHP